MNPTDSPPPGEHPADPAFSARDGAPGSPAPADSGDSSGFSEDPAGPTEELRERDLPSRPTRTWGPDSDIRPASAHEHGPGRRPRYLLAGLVAVVTVILGSTWWFSRRPPATRTCPARAASGLGAWADMFEWAPSKTKGAPTFTLATVDALAAKGVDTLWIQTASQKGSAPLLDEADLRSLIERAHSHGMRVVGWYLPTLSDPEADTTRLLAIADLPVDAVGVDLESRTITDAKARNAAMRSLSARVRKRLPATLPMYAIVMPPTHLEKISVAFWPAFDWASLPASYDAVVPMSYWDLRTQGSEWADAGNHVAYDLERLPALVSGRSSRGEPSESSGTAAGASLPVHVAGGGEQGGNITVAQARSFAGAANGLATGVSIYNSLAVSDSVWSVLDRMSFADPCPRGR